MAWLALDRALRIAETRRVRASRRARWVRERNTLEAEIRSRGYSEKLGAYVGAYGTDDLDAAVLVLPVLEFEPDGSARVASTIDAIRRCLSAGGPLLLRYPPGQDGLGGGEGAFLACSFWLVQALARTGKLDEAIDLFEQLLALANAVGLYGEEMDPSTHDHLGNFPQALTHATLIQALAALRRAGVPPH
jgi:GH15 family glucan-1,4-alpha-glucosidase